MIFDSGGVKHINEKNGLVISETIFVLFYSESLKSQSIFVKNRKNPLRLLAFYAIILLSIFMFK